jgi:hypothetical protein
VRSYREGKIYYFDPVTEQVRQGHEG